MKRKIRYVVTFLVITSVLFLLGNIASAQESTLDTVLKRGVLRVAVFTTLPPWGFLDADHNVDGYDVDLAKQMAKALGVELEITQAQGPNRIPFLQSGKVDIVIMCFGDTLERAKAVAFSKPYAYEFVALSAAKANKDIMGLEDLAGYRVGVERGSTHDMLVTPMLPENTEVLRYETPVDALLAMKQGKVDGVIAGASNSAVFCKQNPAFEIKADILKGKYGAVPTMGVRRGDQEWLNWVNLFIDNINRTGVNQELYYKWFGFPLPRISPTW